MEIDLISIFLSFEITPIYAGLINNIFIVCVKVYILNIREHESNFHAQLFIENCL